MSGYLIFDIGGHELAAPLDEVREVVRVDRLDTLPGLDAPVTGVMHLRGTPVPVCDLRRSDGTVEGVAGAAVAPPLEVGDVVLLAMPNGSLLGVAVDRVVAVVDPTALVTAAESTGAAIAPGGFPDYVVDVMRRTDRTDRSVFLVSMRRLVDRLAREPVAQT